MNFIKTVFKQKNFMFKLGLVIFFGWIIIALIAPIISPYDPIKYQDMSSRFQAPSMTHIFGTDSLGRDVFSRVLYGSRLSISAGVITVAISLILGTVIGGLAGYIGGVFDDVLMRFSEMVQSFPPLVLAMVIAAALGANITNSVLAMAVIWWPNYARLMRSMVISVKENDYILASKLMGASHFRILIKEIIPNSFGPLIIMSTLEIGRAHV